MTSPGIHHVTAIAGDPRRNLDFYAGTLGLRLVKKTVNFDDPGTYHFYFGDAAGSPGSILTFFPWAHAASGRLGTGEVQETAFRVPEAALGFWLARFVEKGVSHGPVETRFGVRRLPFKDPDGLALALVAVPGADSDAAWSAPGIEDAAAVRGLLGVTLLLESTGVTADILSGVFGFRTLGAEGVITRLQTPEAGLGSVVDLRAVGGFPRGRLGRGSVHHLAFRAVDDAAQALMADKLARDHGLRVTDQKDRNYFRSVYAREPGGVLFEIATDDPGFAVDERPAELGRALKLPPALEPQRAAIAARLPDLGGAT
jgi:glyoxalase family protein